MNRRHQPSHAESGYILLAVLCMVALLLIALAVAAPRIAADIQRDKELELMHRGQQYKRAIKLYYKKFGRYPSSIDQLENTNNIRFLRKRYVDPMSGKDDWKIIHFGEAHVKAMGLFGQPIAAGGLATTAGSSVLGGTPGLASSLPPGMTSSFGGTNTISSSGSSSTSSSSTDSSSGSTTSGGPGSSDPSTPTGTPGTGTTTGFGGTGTGTGTGAFGSSGSTFGGAPMVGIASKNTKASIIEYKQQKHYNEWEFVYDPVEDLMSSVSLAGGGATNLNGPGTTGTGTGFGSGPGPGAGGSSGYGNGTGTGFGSGPGPSNPTPPTTPQQ